MCSGNPTSLYLDSIPLFIHLRDSACALALALLPHCLGSTWSFVYPQLWIFLNFCFPKYSSSSWKDGLYSWSLDKRHASPLNSRCSSDPCVPCAPDLLCIVELTWPRSPFPGFCLCCSCLSELLYQLSQLIVFLWYGWQLSGDWGCICDLNF